MNLQEAQELLQVIDLCIEAIESGGDFEKRRWNPDYNWQLMNDALRELKRLRGDPENTIE